MLIFFLRVGDEVNNFKIKDPKLEATIELHKNELEKLSPETGFYLMLVRFKPEPTVFVSTNLPKDLIKRQIAELMDKLL